MGKCMDMDESPPSPLSRNIISHHRKKIETKDVSLESQQLCPIEMTVRVYNKASSSETTFLFCLIQLINGQRDSK